MLKTAYNNVLIRSGEARLVGWSRLMLYSGFNISPRSVFWSADLNGRSDNTDVIPLRAVFMNGKTQFSIRTCLFVFAAASLLLAISMQIRYRYFQLPHHPTLSCESTTVIGDALSALNSKAASLAIPKNLAVNEWEIIHAIKGQTSDPTVQGSDANVLKASVQEILSTKQLPPGTRLEMRRSGIVTLEIPMGTQSTFDVYVFLIRYPGLNNDGSLQMNFQWKPKTKYNWNGKEWLRSSQ